MQHKVWTPVTFDEVCHAFLRAERHKVADENERKSNGYANLLSIELNLEDALNLIDHADLQNNKANHDRLRLLYLERKPILVNIPPDTLWYRVEFLERSDLSSLFAIAQGENIDPRSTDPNNAKLLDVLERLKQIPEKNVEYSMYKEVKPQNWHGFVLWGHERKGPFTIIEGNHRLLTYQRELSEGRDPGELKVPVYIGLSMLRCLWHWPDHFHQGQRIPIEALLDRSWQ